MSPLHRAQYNQYKAANPSSTRDEAEWMIARMNSNEAIDRIIQNINELKVYDQLSVVDKLSVDEHLEMLEILLVIPVESE